MGLNIDAQNYPIYNNAEKYNVFMGGGVGNIFEMYFAITPEDSKLSYGISMSVLFGLEDIGNVKYNDGAYYTTYYDIDYYKTDDLGFSFLMLYNIDDKYFIGGDMGLIFGGTYGFADVSQNFHSAGWLTWTEHYNEDSHIKPFLGIRAGHKIYKDLDLYIFGNTAKYLGVGLQYKFL